VDPRNVKLVGFLTLTLTLILILTLTLTLTLILGFLLRVLEVNPVLVYESWLRDLSGSAGTFPNRPPAPVETTGVIERSASVDIAWEPPIDDGGGPICRYTIVMTQEGEVDIRVHP